MLMFAAADRHHPSIAHRTASGAHAAVTILRYSAAWPIFVARETLAAWDDGLAFMMNVILGDDWRAVGFEETRRSRRRPT
jgi:hypothetical protein